MSYAFANYTTVKVLPGSVIPPVPVELGKARFVQPVLAEEKSVVVKKSEAGRVESSVGRIETAKAPVAEGDILGRLTLTLGGEELASVDLVAAGSVNKLGFFDVFLSLLGKLF